MCVCGGGGGGGRVDVLPDYRTACGHNVSARMCMEGGGGGGGDVFAYTYTAAVPECVCGGGGGAMMGDVPVVTMVRGVGGGNRRGRGG